jgi:prepilin-type N-terminal cleavage/methylation domain-containing protein
MSRTRESKPHAREAGFSLLEIMVTASVFVIAATMGMPALMNYTQRAKLEGSAREIAILLYRTRLEAITRGAPAVVAYDEDARELVAFADVDGVGTNDPPDGIFNPNSGDRYRETDYELARFRVPPHLELRSPDGSVGVSSIDGFANPAPIPAHLAFFRIDGTVGDDGAFRIADERGNFLETRIAAATTARVELRKWDGSTWREQGEGGAWTWH